MKKIHFAEAGMVMLTSVLLAGCFSSDDITWEEVDRMVREEFPAVRIITTAQLAEWLEDSTATQPVLLDVRSPEEFAVSHLADAKPASTLNLALEQLQGVSLDAPIVAYCSVGYRSASLAGQLESRGYTNVFNLSGSIFQWANEGRPLFRDGDLVRKVHPYDKKWGQLLSPEHRGSLP